MVSYAMREKKVNELVTQRINKTSISNFRK